MLKIRKNPFNYFEDLDLLFDNLLIDSSNLLKSKNYHYTENEKEIIIEMAIPGVNKNDIKLVFSLEGNLKIKYDSKSETNGQTHLMKQLR